jgi:hypothetical protein
LIEKSWILPCRQTVWGYQVHVFGKYISHLEKDMDFMFQLHLK